MKQASIANEAGFNRQRSLLRWPSKSVAFLRRKPKKIVRTYISVCSDDLGFITLWLLSL